MFYVEKLQKIYFIMLHVLDLEEKGRWTARKKMNR